MLLVLPIFYALHLLVLTIFVAHISDFRKKKGMIPLMPPVWGRVLIMIYIIPLGILIYAILHIKAVLFVDWLGILLCALGTSLVVLAKYTLGPAHTRAGYCQTDLSHLTISGIYAKIRHPLYVGIWLYMAGGHMTVFAHTYPVLGWLALAFSIFIVGFCYKSAIKEDAFLRSHIGVPFEKYCSRVPAFLPIKQFIPNDREGV